MVALYKIPVIPDINPNRAEQIYSINGCEFAFFGLDYAEKLHGRKQDYTWINEAIEVNRASFDQLEMRTSKQLILDYNPYDNTHFVFQLEMRDDVAVIHSTMLDNPFLPESIIRKIKSYEPTPENVKQGTADYYMWQVYGLGNKAKLKGAIYSNWEMIETVPEEAKLIARGMDFGYSNDPTALVDLYLFNNEIIFDELIYSVGLTNEDIHTRMKSLELNPLIEIFADSSEPKSIEELRRFGWNIKPVKKSHDSVIYGISTIKRYKVFYTRRSINLESEHRKYKWQEDKNGKSLNIPIDMFNHALDASRYVAMMKLGKRMELQFI